MLAPLPRRSGWATFAHSTQPYQPSPKGLPGRPAHRPFRGLLGVHSRYGLHTRAVTVYRDTLTEGFSHFVTSIAAPVASGWSDCRVGFAPTGERRLGTAHDPKRSFGLRRGIRMWAFQLEHWRRDHLSGSPALRRPSRMCYASSVRLRQLIRAQVPSIVHLGSIRRTSAASTRACSMFPSWA